MKVKSNPRFRMGWEFDKNCIYLKTLCQLVTLSLLPLSLFHLPCEPEHHQHHHQVQGHQHLQHSQLHHTD